MHLEHHLVGGYVRYISPHIIIIKLLVKNGSSIVNQTCGLKKKNKPNPGLFKINCVLAGRQVEKD